MVSGKVGLEGVKEESSSLRYCSRHLIRSLQCARQGSPCIVRHS